MAKKKEENKKESSTGIIDKLLGNTAKSFGEAIGKGVETVTKTATETTKPKTASSASSEKKTTTTGSKTATAEKKTGETISQLPGGDKTPVVLRKAEDVFADLFNKDPEKATKTLQKAQEKATVALPAVNKDEKGHIQNIQVSDNSPKGRQAKKAVEEMQRLAASVPSQVYESNFKETKEAVTPKSYNAYLDKLSTAIGSGAFDEGSNWTRWSKGKIDSTVRSLTKSLDELAKKQQAATEEDKQAARDELEATREKNRIYRELDEKGLWDPKTGDTYTKRPADYDYEPTTRYNYDEMLYDQIHGIGAYRQRVEDLKNDAEDEALDRELDDLWNRLENKTLYEIPQHDQATTDQEKEVTRLILGDKESEKLLKKLQGLAGSYNTIAELEKAAEGITLPADAKDREIKGDGALIDFFRTVQKNRGNTAGVYESNNLDQIYLWILEGQEERQNETTEDINSAKTGNPYRWMTPDQVAAFEKHYLSGDEKSAKAYIDALYETWLSQAQSNYTQSVARQAAEGPLGWLYGLESIKDKPLAAMLGTTGSILALFGDEEASKPDSKWYIEEGIIDAIRTGRGEAWGATAQTVFGDWAKDPTKFLNNVFYSMADMGMAAALASGGGAFSTTSKAVQAATQVVMSSEAASATMKENLDKHRDPTEAALYALGAGLAEYITEKFSVEAWLKPNVKEMLGNSEQIAKYIAKNFVTEGAEEGASDIINVGLDVVLSTMYGHQNEIDERANQIRESKPWIKRKDAVNQALVEKMEEVGIDMLAGGISGLGLASMNAGKTAISNRITGETIQSENKTDPWGKTGTEQLLEIAADMQEGTESRKLGEKLGEKIAGGSKASNYEIGRLAQLIIEEAGEQQQNAVGTKIREIVNNQLVAKGVAKIDAAKYGDIIANSLITGEKLTKAQISAMAGSQAAIDLWESFNSATAESAGLVRGIREAASKAGDTIKAVGRLASQAENVGNRMKVAPVNVSEQMATEEEIRQAEGERTGGPREAIVDGQFATVGKMVETTGEDGKKGVGFEVTVNGETRTVQPAEIRAIGRGMAATIRQAAVNPGLFSPRYTNTLLGMQETGTVQNEVEFLQDAVRLRLAAYTGQKMPQTSTPQRIASVLYNDSVAEHNENRKEQTAEGQRNAGKPGSGRATFNGAEYGTEQWNKAVESLSRKVRDQMDAAAELARRAGFELTFVTNQEVEEKGKEGSNQRENPSATYGWENGGGITVNIEGMNFGLIDESGTVGETGEHHILVTLGHEMTHWLQRNSLEGYNRLEKFVMSEMGRNMGANKLSQRLQEVMERRGLSIEDAVSEMVADACDQILGNEEVAQHIQETDKGLYDHIKGFVKDLVERVKKAKAGMSESRSRDAAAVYNSVNRMAEVWLGAYDEAISGKAAEAGAADFETRYSEFEKEYQFAPEFEENLRLFVKDRNAFKSKLKEDELLIGETPQILIDIGIQNKPFMINQAHIESNLGPNADFTHKANVPQLISILRKVSNPVAIICSHSAGKENNSVVVIVDETINGKPVIVPVQISTEGEYNGVLIDINRGSSVHGRNHFLNFMKRAVETELNGAKPGIYYTNKKKADFLRNQGVQFPIVAKNNGLMHKITDNPDFVNQTIKHPRETQSAMNDVRKSQAELPEGFERIGGQVFSREEIDEAGEILEKAYQNPVERFSTADPVQVREDGMIAVHNLDERGLESDLQMGGFPMPSIAVLSENRTWTAYGKISIFFSGEYVNPESGYALFNGDAYTPTLGDAQVNSAEEALAHLANQPQRKLHMAYSMTNMFRDFKRIVNLDEARKKAYRYQKLGPEQITKTYRQANNMEDELFDATESLMAAHGRKYAKSVSTGRSSINHWIGRGILYAAEEMDVREGMSREERYEALQRNLDAAFAEGQAPAFDFGVDGTAVYDKMLDYIAMASELESGGSMMEAKPKSVISFNEVQAVVLPETVDGNLVQELVDAGVNEANIYKYDPADPMDRARKLKEVPSLVPEARFSEADREIISYLNSNANEQIQINQQKQDAILKKYGMSWEDFSPGIAFREDGGVDFAAHTDEEKKSLRKIGKADLKKLEQLSRENERWEEKRAAYADLQAEDPEAQYLAAYNRGDVNRMRELLKDKYEGIEGVVPFKAAVPYTGRVGGYSAQQIANLIKEGNREAINIAAGAMMDLVPDNAVLIPMPPRSGVVNENTDTMLLARAISELTGSPVVNALAGVARESRQADKNKPKDQQMKAADLGFRKIAEIPEGTEPYFIDNLVASGVTAQAAREAFGAGVTLAFAKSTRGGDAGLKNAEPTYYVRSRMIERVVPLSERFNMERTGYEGTKLSQAEIDSEYMKAVESGDTERQQQLVNEAADRAMKDSVARYGDGALIPVYHGTNEQFNIFDTSKHGGEHGTAEGYGIYLTDRQEVSEKYGSRQIAGFFNAKRLAYGTEVTIKRRELADVIRAACEQQARQMAQEEGYENWKSALQDTWISNYVYTPDYRNIADAYRAVADLILQQNDSDTDIVREVMAGMGIRDYDQAMDFYHNVLTPETGIDGMWAEWKNYDGEVVANVFLAFDSSQIKSADPVTYDDDGNVIPLSERFNSEEKDIRWSEADEMSMDVNSWMAGLTPGSLQTEDERVLLQAWKDLRMKISMAIKRQLDYRAKIKRLEANEASLTPQEREDLQSLRAKLQEQQLKQADLEKRLYEVTSSEGYAGMMYQQNAILQDFLYGRTQDEVRRAVDDMVKQVEKAAARLQQESDELRRMEQTEAGKAARAFYQSQAMKSLANQYKKQFNSGMSADEISGRLAILFTMWGDRSLEGVTSLSDLRTKEAYADVAAEAESLAIDLIRTQKNLIDLTGELAMLRGYEVQISKRTLAELKAENRFRNIAEIRRALKGSGVRVTLTDSTNSLEQNAIEEEISGLRAVQYDENGNQVTSNSDLVARFVDHVQELMQKEEDLKLHEADIDAVTEELMALASTQNAYAKKVHGGGTVEASLMRNVRDMIERSGRRAEEIARIRQMLSDAGDNGERAKGLTRVLQQDVKQAIEYYNKTAKHAAQEEKRKVKEGLIAQLKSDHAKALLAEQEKWKELIKSDKRARALAESNMTKRSMINTVAKRMKNLLLAETDQKNIPEEAKPLARQLVKMLSMHDYVGYRKVLLMGKKDVEALMANLRALDARDGEFRDEDLNWLIVAPDTDHADWDVHDQVVMDLINIESGLLEYRTAEGQGNVSLKDRNDALDKIQKAVSEIYGVIRARQQTEIGGRRMLYKELAMQARDDMQNSRFKGDWIGITKALGMAKSAVVYGNTTPEYFFKNLKNGIMDLLWDEYHKAENRSGLEIAKAQKRMEEIAEETGFSTWDMKTRREFRLENGKTVSLTLGEMMSLYATWQREYLNQLETNGPEKSYHLEKGGFYVEEESKKVAGRELFQKRVSKVTENDIDMIRDAMTEEQLDYVSHVVSYLSNEMSDLGNEASMRMYGIKKYKEKYYFPFEIWSGIKAVKSDKGAAGNVENRAAHPSFSNRRSANASNALMIRDFTDMAVKHISQMITYNTFAPAVEMMQRVMNTQLDVVEGDESTKQNVRTAFAEAYGKDAIDYFDDFQQQINGGAVRVEKTLWDKLLSGFRKMSVSGSISVALQQPLSYIRAAGVISPKYLATSINLGPRLKRIAAEMRKYSGVAVIKQMGRFDMNFGQSAIDYISPEKKTGKVRKGWDWTVDKLTILPEVMDTWTWCNMWEAVKKEQAALHPEMKKGSDAFMNLVADRFNEVMRRTQVYDSVLVKSRHMRSSNQIIRRMTSFMAEPTLTVNTVADAYVNRKEKGGKLHLVNTLALFMLSAAAQAAVKGIMGSGRTPDEKKTWVENFWYRFESNLMNEMNLFSNIPGYSDLISLLKGEDVTDDAYSVITKLIKAKDTMEKWIAGEPGDTYRYLEDTAGVVIQVFSRAPAKNIMRDLRAMYNWFIGKPYADRETSPAVLKYQAADVFFSADNLLGVVNKDGKIWGSKNTDYYARLWNAAKAGDEQAADEITEYLTKGRGLKGDTISNGLRKEIKNDDDTSVADRVKALQQDGMSEDDITKWIAEKRRKNEISHNEAVNLYLQVNPKKDKDDAYFYFEKADYREKTGESAGSSDYFKLNNALKKGDEKEINAAVKELSEHGYTKEKIDKHIKDYYPDAYKDGEITRKQAEAGMKKYDPDASDDDIYWKLNEMEYERETGNNENGKYYKIDSALDRKDEKAVAEAEKEMRDHGMNQIEINDSYEYYFKDRYKNGKITKKEAEAGLKKYIKGITSDDIFWILDRVDYQKETGKNPGGNAFYYRVYDAMDANRSDDIKKALRAMLNHGKEAGSIKAALNAKYKPLYLAAASGSNKRTQIRNALQIAYKALGYKSSDADKAINNWTKPKKKK